MRENIIMKWSNNKKKATYEAEADVSDDVYVQKSVKYIYIFTATLSNTASPSV